MQAVETLLDFKSRLAVSAANQDYVKSRAAPAPAVVTIESVDMGKSLGWDPHEVWRRMIKEPRDRRLNHGC